MSYQPLPKDQNASSQIGAVVRSPELERQISLVAGDTFARHLLDAMPGVVFVLNSQRQVVFINRTLRDLLGVESIEPLLGRKPGDVLECRSALHAEWGCGTGEACSTCGALTAIIAGQNGHEDVQECLLARQVGDEIVNLTLRVWSVPMQFQGEHFTVLSGVDVSHERRRLALERTFFHDILNLVGSIRGFAEVMELDPTVNSVDLGKKIFRASQRAIDEIDAQRLLLAAEKGELQVRPDHLDVRDLLEEIKTLFCDLTGNRTLMTTCEDGDIPLVADKVIIGRILYNMVKNALEASTADEIITIGVRRSGPDIFFWVHNRSVIPKLHHARIFQRDFSTKGPGRGLGTYSMKLLADLHGADVSFSSSAAQGTTFTLRVPVKDSLAC